VRRFGRVGPGHGVGTAQERAGALLKCGHAKGLLMNQNKPLYVADIFRSGHPRAAALSEHPPG
jgi:hypothetical protein